MTRVSSFVLLAASIALAATSVSVLRRQGENRRSTDPPVAAKGKLGQDLFLAIDHRDSAAVDALLRQGADPNAKNGLEFTPMDIAAASHQTDVMRKLLDAGADPAARNTYGTALTFASMTANVEGAELLLAKGVPADLPRTDGLTPLMMAANVGVPPLVHSLLEHKASVKATDENDTTALMLAARNGHAPVVGMLIDAGSPIDAADHDGDTALMAAAKNGHADCVKLLLAHGAKPDMRDKSGRTALLLAASYGDYPDVVKVLAKGGADMNAKDAKGRSAATCAAMRQHTAELHALSGHGSAGSARDARGAVSLSLKLVQSSIKEFDRNSSCVSCHQEGLGRIATGSARAHGYALDMAALKPQTMRVDGAIGAMKPLHEAALHSAEAMKQVPLIEINEVGTTYSWLLAGKAAQHEPQTVGTTAMAMVLARQQMPNGCWSFSVPREPMQSSNFTLTALTVRSLQAYAPASAHADVAKRLAKAKAWLSSAKAVTCDDRAFKLLGLAWAKGSTKDRAAATKAILTAQLPDGGWAQVPGMRSDAYATGQALCALHEGGGVSTDSGAYRRGVRYLLRNQDDDGSWYVTKRALPNNNYFDGGFPHGESQYASFNATCWAMMALLDTFKARG